MQKIPVQSIQLFFKDILIDEKLKRKYQRTITKNKLFLPIKNDIASIKSSNNCSKINEKL